MRLDTIKQLKFLKTTDLKIKIKKYIETTIKTMITL